MSFFVRMLRHWRRADQLAKSQGRFGILSRSYMANGPSDAVLRTSCHVALASSATKPLETTT
jgi:hypothetical protein